MSRIINDEEVLGLEGEEGGPIVEAMADMGAYIAQVLSEKILENPLIKEEDRLLAFSTVCQMVSLQAIVELAEEVECDPLEVVDTWADSFYDALGASDEDEDEEDGEEDEEAFEDEDEDMERE